MASSEGGKIGAWVSAETKTGLVILCIDSHGSKTPTYVLAIWGQ